MRTIILVASLLLLPVVSSAALVKYTFTGGMLHEPGDGSETSLVPSTVTHVSAYFVIDDQYFSEYGGGFEFYADQNDLISSWYISDGANSLSDQGSIKDYLYFDLTLSSDRSVAFGSFSATAHYSFENPLLGGDLVSINQSSTSYCQRDYYYVEPSGWCSVSGTFVADGYGVWTAEVVPLPAAVWLLGSALGGLGACRRFAESRG